MGEGAGTQTTSATINPLPSPVGSIGGKFLLRADHLPNRRRTDLYATHSESVHQTLVISPIHTWFRLPRRPAALTMHLEVVLLTVCLYDAVSSFNSNAIKTGSGAVHPASVTPQVSVHHGAKNHAIEPSQFSVCLDDQDCSIDQFCSGSSPGVQHCLNCRRRRKRCARDAMCCPGTRCSNGMCISNDGEHIHGEIEETLVESWGADQQHATVDTPPRRTTLAARSHPVKGQEGDVCLRSSDCAQGLCCARHFWSKICKPVLREGQVCTKHKRKGSHGLEIFQRCDCAQGFSCRMQRGGGPGPGKSSRLHTCQ